MQRNDSAAGRRCAAFFCLQSLTALLVWLAPANLWLLAAMAVHGFVLVHLFALLHEAAHMTAFKTRRFNTWAAWYCGVVINLGPKYFQYEHTQHHTYTQNLDRDPQHIPLPESFAAYCLYLSGLPYWYNQFKSLFTHAVNRIPASEKRFIPLEVQPQIVREARIITGIYAIVAALAIVNGWLWPLYLWVIPLLLGEPAMRFIRMTEHVGMPVTADLRQNTRTNHVASLYRFLCWNMNFHAEHHFAPSVPFHALPALNQRIGSQLSATQGYFAAHRQIRTLIDQQVA